MSVWLSVHILFGVVLCGLISEFARHPSWEPILDLVDKLLPSYVHFFLDWFSLAVAIQYPLESIVLPPLVEAKKKAMCFDAAFQADRKVRKLAAGQDALSHQIDAIDDILMDEGLQEDLTAAEVLDVDQRSCGQRCAIFDLLSCSRSVIDLCEISARFL